MLKLSKICSIITAVVGVFGVPSSHVSFVIKEGSKILETEGDVKTRHSPCSTFKIPLALMGYDLGVLKDAVSPCVALTPELKTQYLKGSSFWMNPWEENQTPTSWIQYSCVWYSQWFTSYIGVEKFNAYVKNFDYGNGDTSGDKGKNNGLTNSWLSSSLRISVEEQILFLEKLLNNALPVSSHAHEMTKTILFVQEMENGWKLYGKTGSGNVLDASGLRTDMQIGWYVGWIEKNNRHIVFAFYTQDTEKNEIGAGKRAKECAIKKLQKIAI